MPCLFNETKCVLFLTIKSTIMKKYLFSLFSFALLGFSNPSFSQTNRIFMSVPGSTGFDGGVTVVGYEKNIEVLSYSDGLQACGQASRGTTPQRSGCKTSFSGFSVMIPLSPAVSGFQAALLQGKVLNVNVAQTKNAGGRYNAFYEIHMENVTVVSIQEGASSEAPLFSLQLQPEKIRWTVTTQNPDGSKGDTYTAGWDFVKNVAY
jgi:type VI protein secretion system component Hcp